MTNEIEKFNSTKYGIVYIKILQKANNEDRTKLKKEDPSYVYYESHHILPKSIYPEYKNLKDFPLNSVLLTAREHFICHILLMKHYRKLNNKGAFFKMSRALHRLNSDGKHNSKIYEKLRLNLSHTEETKEKMRGRVFTMEHKSKLSKANLGKVLSKETRLKMSNSRTDIGLKNYSKLINIYDNNGMLRFECDGNFQKMCKEHKLPFDSLKHSYQNNGVPLYSTTAPNILSRIKKTDNYKLYNGWYAIIK